MDEIVKSAPNVTIVMPAYNAEKYIAQAIQSILEQTYTDFILLIINDGSIDSTEDIILSFKDKRIHYVKNEQNIGLVATLNKGIGLVDTPFLARMDADDIALPNRLEKELTFLIANPEIGVCGSKYEIFGDEQGVPNIPMDDEEIKAALLFSNVICHPTVVLRTLLLKENQIGFGVPFNYSDGYGHKILELEDYAIWHKLKGVTKFVNLQEVLLKYRREGQNLTAQKLDVILGRKKQYYGFLLSELNIIPSEMNLLLHISPKYISNAESPAVVVGYKAHLDEIILKNEQLKVYPQEALKKIIDHNWKRFFYFLPPFGWRYVYSYWKCSNSFSWQQFSYFLKHRLKK